MPRKFTPQLFLLAEFFMIFPSILFILGFIKYGLIENVFVSIIGPAAGGFVSYNCLERYKLDKKTEIISKIILGYAIIEIGIVLLSTLIS